jgi:hypothetical protein
LKTKQIDLATAAKQRIEQKQRDEVKQRKEANQKWKTKYFHEQGEHWIYIKPLVKRIQRSEPSSLVLNSNEQTLLANKPILNLNPTQTTGIISSLSSSQTNINLTQVE